MTNEQVFEILIDIQSRLGRIEERVSRVHLLEQKVDKSLQLGQENKERTDDVITRVEKLETQKEWARRTIIGAIVSAGIALVSAVLSYIGGN